MGNGGLQVVVDEGVAWLILDRPEQLNAFDGGDYRDLRVALERSSADSSIRAIVLTGNGRAFSAGAHRSLLDGSASPSQLQLASTEFNEMLDVLGRFDKPLIAAVNGVAVGIGCTVLLYCDLVVMNETARLRLPFTALGIVPEAGSSVLLPARARWPDAVWAMLSSEWIDAQKAYDMGIAWRVVPDSKLAATAAEAASAIAALDPAAVSATKRLLTAGRADTARAAIDRELAEMAALFGRGETNPH
jgi:enoyl-CoA hydratase/carnithine racemase